MAHHCPDCYVVCQCDESHRLPIVHRFVAALDCVHHTTLGCIGPRLRRALQRLNLPVHA